MWDELWIAKELSAAELALAIARAHGVATEQVEVIDGIAAEPMRDAEIVVSRTRGGGEFATRIQLSGAEPDDRRVFCAKLASALDCRLLGDDGNVNPATFMLYEPGNALRVEVDAHELEQHAPRVLGPYDARANEDSHPTRPIRRYPEPSEHRTTRGGQVAHIVNDYMVEGLPRPPLVTWRPEITELYNSLQRLLGTLAFRKASPDELTNVRTWSETLASAFTNHDNAGWFVIEVLEAAGIVLAAPWDPDLPAIEIAR